MFGEKIYLFPSSQHFANVNVIGTDLLWQLVVAIDRQKKVVSLPNNVMCIKL